MNARGSNIRNYLGVVGSVCTVVGTLWQLFGTEERWAWPWALLLTAVVSLAIMLQLSPGSVSLKFLVRRACKVIKLRASRTIDIAAGDCSWLGDELAELQKWLTDEGIELRMVCEETANPSCLENIESLAGGEQSNVRRYGEESLLRCIIIDRNSKSHREMLLLERRTTANEIVSLIPTPGPLQRDHIARVIDADSPLFDAICLAYDYLYQNAEPLTAE
jgi:hypothetical protein